MTKHLLIWSLFGIVLCTGCETPSEPRSTFSSSVVATLTPESGKQSIEVYRVQLYGASSNSSVSDAFVAVNGIRFTPLTDPYGYTVYSLDTPANFFKPDSTYTLFVTRNGEPTITGNTTVPSAVVITSPARESEVQLPNGQYAIVNLNLTWQPSRTAKGYLFSVTEPPQKYLSGSDTVTAPAYTLSSKPLTETATSLNLYREGRHVVKVFAFDENYDLQVVRGVQTAGLSNAYGIFASMSVDSVIINVKASVR